MELAVHPQVPAAPAPAPASLAPPVSVDASQEAAIGSTPFGRALLERTRHLREQHYVVDRFETLAWTCSICESTYKVAKYLKEDPEALYAAPLKNHAHPSYCQSCLANWVNVRLAENCGEIRCVIGQCTEILVPQQMWGRLPHKILRKWENIRLMGSLKVMTDLRFCPMCEVPSYLSATSCNDSVCPYCNFAFCNKCLLPPHSALRCSVAVHELDPEVQKRFFEERLNIQWKAANTKPCPQCRTAIEKKDGCSHMTCKSCTYQFCWICLQKYAPGRAIVGVEANGEKCRCPPPATLPL